MQRNFFVTGLPKAGKTTLLRRIVNDLRGLGVRVGGFISPEEKHHGTRTGFYVQDIDTGKIARLADVNADGPKVSKYHVDIKSFESVAMPALERAAKCDAVIIDEIGRMELKSVRFAERLDGILESKTPLIASLQSDYVEQYGAYGDVLYLTGTNHEDVHAELLGKIMASREKRRPGTVKKAADKPEKKPAEAKKEKRKKETAEEEEDGGEAEEKSLKNHIKELLGF